MAFAPTGVLSDGVKALGVMGPGVEPLGVPTPGVVMEGVAPPGVAREGVSSHRDRRLLAPGVSLITSTGCRSTLGVSAHPTPCPGVSAGVGWTECDEETWW